MPFPPLPLIMPSISSCKMVGMVFAGGGGGLRGAEGAIVLHEDKKYYPDAEEVESCPYRLHAT